MIVRPCRASDLDAVAAMWNGNIRDTLITFNPVEKTVGGLREILSEREAAGHGFFVAELEEEIVGFVTYGQFRGGDGYSRTMEHTISLRPEARGRGVGRALMATMEDHARSGGVHSMWAGVSGANPEGRNFHAALGYREIATLPEVGYKWGQWLDLILMQKILYGSPEPKS